MKKLVCLLLGLAMCLSVGCSKKEANVTPQAPKVEEAEKTEGDSTSENAFLPQKEIEVVVPSSAGGGSDLHARTFADISQKNSFSPKSFMVNNMPGGAGAVAYAYTAGLGKANADNSITIMHSGQILSTIVNNSPVTAADLTYLPIVAFDNLTIGVYKDSEIKDIETLIKKATENPESIKIGGSQRGNSDHLACEMFNKYTGAKASFVAFDSNGDAMTALLGGHLDAAFFNPSECIGQVEAGEVIPLVAYTTERMGGLFADTRTFTEVGYPDLVLREMRGFLGSPDMSPEAIAFYEDVIKKVTETPEWKNNYISKNNLESVYMTSAEAKEFLEKETEKYVSIFKEVGVIE
ncbi:MAG: tripartite tricarboxylate transporter substrate binding protein [Lachnospiraceae bacterium]|nr:tripartite tricarboxylate transporter substrate binding protein [Lachnospiraceae bacterium]